MHEHERSACSFCRQVFPTADIVAWVDGGVTPLCPLCGIDSVAPGDATPEVLLDRHRCWFGHPPHPDDPPALRQLQRLSERLTVSADEVGAGELLEAVRSRASLARALDAIVDEERYQPLWLALFGIDKELRHHGDRFQALDVAARLAAWRSSTFEPEEMPHWCRPEQPPS